jgi:hypothetical protein
MKLTTHLSLVLRLRMSGDIYIYIYIYIYILPTYAFIFTICIYLSGSDCLPILRCCANQTIRAVLYPLTFPLQLFSCCVIHILCHRLIVQHLIQQTAQSVINNHLSLMSLLHVSTSRRSSLGRCTKGYKYHQFCLRLVHV